MRNGKEMRKLEQKWLQGRQWPKRVEWIEIHGIRGWTGQRIDFNFPFTAIVGENGSGKTTILQALAAIYREPSTDSGKQQFASDFFPDTPWEKIEKASIAYSVREGDKSLQGSVRKPTDRWRGNPDRRSREVRYIDLRRTQPLSSRVGYSRIAKPQHLITENKSFDQQGLERLSAISGRSYVAAGTSLTNADENRWVPVVGTSNEIYSGFHQGAGETALVDLLETDFPKFGLILIDEVETSLHPRAQRRLMKDLANHCRTLELQIIITTHSPYILEELPIQGRIYVMNTPSAPKTLITGVSPYFAMTQMDDERHPECDLYVEDSRSQTMLEEIIVVARKELLPRFAIVPFGAASVGQHLGIMVAGDKFPRKSLVFLDGDQEASAGCLLLPGEDSPERVVFDGLSTIKFNGVAERVGRPHPEVVDALEAAMMLSDHHDWVKSAAERIIIGGNTLWRAMCSIWAMEVLSSDQYKPIIDCLENALNSQPFVSPKPSSNISPLPLPKSPNTPESGEKFRDGEFLFGEP